MRKNSDRSPGHSAFSPPPRRFHAGDLVILILTGFFLIVSLCLLVASLRMLSDPWRKQAWIETPGNVLRSETLRPARGSASALVLYHYEFGGREYRSDRTNFGTYFAGNERNFVASHPAGSPVTVFVDPDDPSAAVLTREPSGGWLLLPIALALMLLPLWLLRAWRSTRRRDGRRQTWRRAFGSPYLRSRMRRHRRA